MPLEKKSSCKVNLLLNILGKRADGFHELETVMHPISIQDRLEFEQGGTGIQLTCSNPTLPVDSSNLVFRAAKKFLESAHITDGVRLHLDKQIPLAAGLGGGSGNAAMTLLGLNELFGQPLPHQELTRLAAELGSDVAFFLQARPALATGRGEKVEPLPWFLALRGRAFLLIHPGFGVSTPWAYQNLSRFPAAVNGRAGRARDLIELLSGADTRLAAGALYNSLEAPVLEKYPILRLYQEFLLAEGALGALMSGSGSTTFAVAENLAQAKNLKERFLAKFGSGNWTAAVAAVED
jgi:4-diphosphocytidyl-2-C-methyl-D-erythritol kinase